MTPEGHLTPEDLVFELGVPLDQLEDAHWLLPCHVKVRDGSWSVDPADLHVWAEWANVVRGRVAA